MLFADLLSLHLVTFLMFFYSCTSIPHQLLKGSLRELVMEAFLKRGATYLVEK